jgi:hypothetical protein
MTAAQARLWIIRASLVSYGCAFVFFVLAPAIGYPLYYADAINVLKIIIPIFASYLGAAVLFLGTGENVEVEEQPNAMLGLLVRWPVIIFSLGMVALLVGFPLSNGGKFSGSGMTPNTLSLLVSILTGLLAATTGAISSFLFKVEKRTAQRASLGQGSGGRAGTSSSRSKPRRAG